MRQHGGRSPQGQQSWPSLGAAGRAPRGWLPPSGQCQNGRPWCPEKMRPKFRLFLLDRKEIEAQSHPKPKSTFISPRGHNLVPNFKFPSFLFTASRWAPKACLVMSVSCPSPSLAPCCQWNGTTPLCVDTQSPYTKQPKLHFLDFLSASPNLPGL